MADSVVATEEQSQQQSDESVDQQASGTEVQSVELSEADASVPGGPAASIDLLLDMEVPVTVVMGQTQLSIQRLLQLGPGSVVQLDKSVDMPAELYLKDRKFATADIVVVEDCFAVRIKQILTEANPNQE